MIIIVPVLAVHIKVRCLCKTLIRETPSKTHGREKAPVLPQFIGGCHPHCSWTWVPSEPSKQVFSMERIHWENFAAWGGNKLQ